MEGNAKMLKNTNPPSPRGFSMRSDFVGIARKVQKLFSRNGMLMSSIALLIIFLNSILMALNKTFIKGTIDDFSYNASFLQKYSPNSTEYTNILLRIKDDLQLFGELELIFFCAFSFTSLLFVTASTLGAAVAYCGKDLPTKELLSRAMKSLKRVFITWFYTKLLDLSFYLLIAILLLLLVMISNSTSTILYFSLTILILAAFYRTYLHVVWNLALVVSVLEEKCGLEALGIAGRLIKGFKLHGFVLNLVGAFSMSVFYGLGTNLNLVGAFSMSIYGLGTIGTVAFPSNASGVISFIFSYSIICLISMFLLMAYTVLYYECKVIHGEELESQGTMEYTKVTSSEFPPLLREI